MFSVSPLNSNMVWKFGRKSVQCSVRPIKKSFLEKLVKVSLLSKKKTTPLEVKVLLKSYSVTLQVQGKNTQVM